MMNSLSEYIIEKLKIDKNISINKDNPDDKVSDKELSKLEEKIEDLTTYLDKDKLQKIFDMTESIVERYQLAYIIQEYCKINSSKYDDISKVLMYFTDKGGIAVYYDKHYLGTANNIKDYPITIEFLKKFNLLVED